MKLQINLIKPWILYFLVILFSVYIHEIGHCIVAWVNGISAIPTPAKEYALDPIPEYLEKYIDAGGVAGTIIVSLVGISFFLFKPTTLRSTIMAGTIASPFSYTIRFLILGRGHGDTEFQQAQSAFGFSYSGHSLDWIFVAFCLITIATWAILSKPGLRSIPKLLLGVVSTFIFMVALQEINNKIFDPIIKPLIHN